MPKHLIQKARDTEVNIVAIGAANDACEGQFYFAHDTGNYYYGLTDGTLAGPLALGGSFLIATGEYTDDTDAGLNGVVVGEWYELSDDNSFGLPAGTIKRRKE